MKNSFQNWKRNTSGVLLISMTFGSLPLSAIADPGKGGLPINWTAPGSIARAINQRDKQAGLKSLDKAPSAEAMILSFIKSFKKDQQERIKEDIAMKEKPSKPAAHGGLGFGIKQHAGDEWVRGVWRDIFFTYRRAGRTFQMSPVAKMIGDQREHEIAKRREGILDRAGDRFTNVLDQINGVGLVPEKQDSTVQLEADYALYHQMLTYLLARYSEMPDERDAIATLIVQIPMFSGGDAESLKTDNTAQIMSEVALVAYLGLVIFDMRGGFFTKTATGKNLGLIEDARNIALGARKGLKFTAEFISQAETRKNTWENVGARLRIRSRVKDAIGRISKSGRIYAENLKEKGLIIGTRNAILDTQPVQKFIGNIRIAKEGVLHFFPNLKDKWLKTYQAVREFRSATLAEAAQRAWGNAKEDPMQAAVELKNWATGKAKGKLQPLRKLAWMLFRIQIAEALSGIPRASADHKDLFPADPTKTFQLFQQAIIAKFHTEILDLKKMADQLMTDDSIRPVNRQAEIRQFDPDFLAKNWKRSFDADHFRCFWHDCAGEETPTKRESRKALASVEHDIQRKILADLPGYEKVHQNIRSYSYEEAIEYLMSQMQDVRVQYEHFSRFADVFNASTEIQDLRKIEHELNQHLVERNNKFHKYLNMFSYQRLDNRFHNMSELEVDADFITKNPTLNKVYTENLEKGLDREEMHATDLRVVLRDVSDLTANVTTLKFQLEAAKKLNPQGD